VSTADVTGVVVTLSERPAVITGTVTSDRAPSFALVAMKRDERPWDDDLRPTDTAGHFELDSLAPGDYRLAALTLDEALRGDDTAVRALAESRSVRVRVAGGDAKVVSLTTGAR
jgi:hypothetical protein